jgi:MFS superfamily sulfate permease-like transporter
VRTVYRSIRQIAVIFGYLIIIMIITSAFMYMAEQEIERDGVIYRVINGEEVASPFQNIPLTLYWSITTLSTTGYGDITPVTPWGKLLAGITMLFGIMVIALPTSILGSNFVQEWQLHTRLKSKSKFKTSRDKNAFLKSFQNSKSEQIKVLRTQNDALFMAVEEMQNRLSDLNPPAYYQKYRHLQRLYSDAMERIHRLEHEVSQLRHSHGITRSSTAPLRSSSVEPSSRSHKEPLQPAVPLEHFYTMPVEPTQSHSFMDKIKSTLHIRSGSLTSKHEVAAHSIRNEGEEEVDVTESGDWNTISFDMPKRPV